MRVKKIMSFTLCMLMMVTVLSGKNITEIMASAEDFKIVSPINNSLIGAGYFDIKWTEPSEKAVKSYKIFVDGKHIATTNDTKYEYYTTNVKMYQVYVTAEFIDNSTSTTNTVSFGVTKKGLCANEEMARYLEPEEMNIGWYYNWASHPHNYNAFENTEYVPMIWGRASEGDISYVVSAGYKHMLAYNEPDMGGDVGGSKIDVNTAISNWYKFIGNNYYLGSPAPALSPSWDNGVWFRTFMNGIDQSTVDFIALHCYYSQYTGKEAAQTFLREVVDKTYEMYHKPIWITEFAVDGWAYDDSAHIDSVKEFMEEAVKGLNEREYVERFAWFSFNTTDQNNGIASLYNYETGDLTELGRLYVDLGNPEGYLNQPKYGQTFAMSSTTRKKLLDNTIYINGQEYTDFVDVKNTKAVSTSDYNGDNSAIKAIDNDISTRWESKWDADPSNLTLDLGKSIDIKQVSIIWEAAGAKEYNIEVSEDGQKYYSIAGETDGISYDYKNDNIILSNTVTARYIRVNGVKRNTSYGYSIRDIAVYGIDKTKEILVSDKVKIEGYQISTVLQGSRVIGAVEPEIDTKKVKEWGFVYGISSANGTDFNISDTDMIIGSDNIYVKSYGSTSIGTINPVTENWGSQTYFVRTTMFTAFNIPEFTSKYKVRAYAKLEDGTYRYSKIYTYSIYGISSTLYQNKKMNNYASHQYLYNNILKVVNSTYEEVDYNWSSIITR